jgi:hypothetical protein
MKALYKVQRKFLFVFVFCSAFLATAPSHASTYKEDVYRDIRMLGRGNAGISSVDDGLAVFMNPAGLGFAQGVSFRGVDFSFGGNQSFKDSYAELLPMLTGGSSGGSLSDTFSPFLGRPLGLQGSFFPHVMAPGVLLGGWDYFDFQFLYSDPVYPQLSVETRNDFGLILGFAKNFAGRLSVGASIRYHNRRQLIESYTADSLLSLNLGSIRDSYKKGVGYGLNLGIQYKQLLLGDQRLSVGVVLEDAGQTRFKNATRQPTPLKQFQQLGVGIGYGIKSTLVDASFNFDAKDLLDRQGSYTKKLYTGVELNLPTADLRAGFYQGYWTLGFTLRMLPLIEIDGTSYAEERGAIAGQRRNRWYLIGVRVGIDLKGVSASGKKKQKYSIDRIR